ncbi:hypothetical protein BA193_06990 [Yersinia pseudotuberculosis]|uniref:Uncharacterized protein n=1 Tax=Yersinia pseudotuberculosis serotype I (strain IP32953) TaxID=273123 RepID=Q66EE1_YERPS|nr:hypothetical protein BLA52_14010 [Yersinia pseudotuberculosis]CAH19992.1 hypothetical protein YPTB0752 [Yersinia pseudotuberculosis IP 32953]PSH25924.1 hypothetical protein BLA50_10355 [Yersinia pseudotuberculosis]PSH29181.1 hypothetical protein BLA51_15285 [Yersinia pseudotuberculosis]PSH38455.1 hypothetical protein BA197_06375 [Yersinia pseudotuberculosis]
MLYWLRFALLILRGARPPHVPVFIRSGIHFGGVAGRNQSACAFDALNLKNKKSE